MSEQDKPFIERELTDEDRAKLAELNEQVAKFEQQKRWSDMIKTYLAIADVVGTKDERVDYVRRAGSMYVEKASNQAEAIKCYEQILQLEPHDRDAIGNLKVMYEKRRDWESLLRVMQREADLLDAGDQPARYLEMAQIATQRLRKPEICIEMWELVLRSEPGNAEALDNLATLYERAREWTQLAKVLEHLTEWEQDATKQKANLQKLGMIYADKIGDDSGAVHAFQRLLVLDPDDRRAQEQLKRRYVALKAWDQLEEFYATSDKWDELIRLVEKEAETAETPIDEKIGLLFRAARLWREKKDKLDRAARAYEKVLELDAENLDAAEALSPIYEGAGDAKKLAGVYEVRLKHIDDPDAKVALLRETGLLYEERLRAPDTAFERYLAAFAAAPTSEVIREDIFRLADKVENGWERVKEAYKGTIDGTTDEDLLVELRVDFGRVLNQMGMLDDAIEQYRGVIEKRGDHTEAIDMLGELFRKTERYRDLLDVYEKRIELATDPSDRLTLSYQKAALWQNELADPAQAIASYQAILDEYGDEQAEAFRALDELYEKQGRWDDFAAILERRIELGPESTEELAALKFRLAIALEMHLSRKPEAVEHLREVLTLMPEHDGARMRLEGLLDDAEVGVQAARILEAIYEVRGDWEMLIRALRVLHAGADAADEKLELITKIGRIYSEHVQDAEKAFDAYAEALRGAPDSESTLEALEVLALEQEKFPALAKLVEELAEATDIVDLARSLWIKAARIHSDQLDDVDASVRAYLKVLDLDPGDLEVLGALETLYRRTERWRDLVAVLRRRKNQTQDPLEQEELLVQMASIHDQALREPPEAIRLYQEILDIDPASRRALSALDDLYARQGMWGDLADNVDRQLRMADDPDEQINLMLQLAQLREQRMSAVEAAIRIYSDVLEREPSNAVALASLERLVQSNDHQTVIAEILEPIYHAANEFAKLIGIHEIQAKHASAPDRRVELLHRIAELYEVALDDPQSAFRSMARALAEDPANTRTQEELERLNRVAGGPEELASVYEERVETLEDLSLASHLLMKAAQIRETQLDDNETAIAHYRRVLGFDETQLDAATALERLYQLTEKYDELASIYLTKSRMLDIPDDQKDYLFRGAHIYEEILERPEAAIEVYNQVLAIDPDDAQALDKLIELYLRLEKWELLLQVYTKKADIVVDPEEKKRLYAEVGAVYERELGNVEKAIDTYQRILEIDPDDVTAMGRLDALYQATQNWQELMSVLEREADLASDPSEVISYRYRIADLWHRRLGDPLRAVDIYREILDTNPTHDPTLNALESMLDEKLEPVAAAEVLERVYRGMGEFARLIRVHEVQIAYEQDPIRKVELLHQQAELYEVQLDQTQKAFEAYGRALPFDSANEMTLGSLQRLADQVGGWTEVTRLYDLEIDKLKRERPDDVSELALRTAQIYEVQVGDVDSAIARYALVVEADGSNVTALEALDRLYEATERWPELADTLTKEIQVAASPDEILGLQFRLGQIYQNFLEDVDGAISQYREILAAAPEHGPSLSALELLFAEGVRPSAIGEVLEPLYRMQESWDKLVNVHEIQLNYEHDAGERVQMMHRIAEIAEERAQDPEKAFLWMQRALLEDPTHDHSTQEVERLGRILDGWAQLANTYADTLETTTVSPEIRVDIGKRLARVYEEELADVQRAEASYRFVLSLHAKDGASLEALDRIYLEHGAHNALADVLRKRIASTDHADDLVELHFRLGQVLENDLGLTNDAITTYRYVLDELRPDHGESVRALQEIYIRLADWQNLYGALEKEIDVVYGDSSQAEIYAKMARLGLDQLGDSEKSIDLWKKVLDLRGEDPEALSALGNIYASHENWRDLVDILEREVAIADDDALRVQIYSDLGRIWYAKLGRERSSLESWEHVLDIDPANVHALQQIAEIHRATKQWHELADTLHRIVEVGAATMDEASIEHVFMQLGHIYDVELSQPMDAADVYQKALEVNPRSFPAMACVEIIYRREAMWREAIAVMERRVEAYDDPEDKIEQLLAIAYTYQTELDDKDAGTSAFQRILELTPMDDYAFLQLEDRHMAAGRWEELIEMYLTRVESTESDKEQVTLLRKVAKVYDRHLGDLGQAFDALQIAWTVDYTDRKTSDELERVTAATKRWNELLTAANNALQEVEDPNVKIAICLSCAKWYGVELKHPEYAIPYYQQILALDPNNVAAMQQMADLYRTTQQWDTLAQVLGRLVEMTDDPVVQSQTYVQMGDLAEEHLGVPDQAGQYYLKAREVNPRNVVALEALERIYRVEQKWTKLLDVLVSKADSVDTEERYIAAKLQIAEVYEDRVAQPEEAIATYREVYERDSANLVALKGLERLYARTARWQNLLEILEREFEVVNTERERIAILLRLAAMWEEEFLKNAKAAECLEKVLDIDPNHVDALNGLARLYRNMQEWSKLVETYERHIQATPDRSEKIRCYKAQGDVYQKEVSDVDRAVDSYLNVLSIDDKDVEALDALATLYDKREDYSSSLDMMEQLVRLVDDPKRQVELKFRMGRNLDEHLGDRVAALDHYQTALDLEPGHLPTLEAMRKIQIDSGDWLAAAKLLQQESEYTESGRLKAERLVELGKVYQQHLDEEEKAIEAFEQAYKLDEDNEDAALPLVDHYAKEERWGDAFPLLQMLVKRSGKRDQSEQHRLAFMLGEASSAVKEKEEAIKAFTKAYQLDSHHLPSLTGLARAHYDAADWEKAFKYYQMLLVHHRDSLGSAETTDIFYRLGVVKREQGERRKALNMFDKALEEDAGHRPTLEAVVGMHETQNEWEQVVHFKKRILENVLDEDERFKLLGEVGDVWAEKLKNHQKAIEAYSEASDIKPDNHVMLHKLLDSYQKTKSWPEVIDTIDKIASLDDRPAMKAKYAYTVAVITRDELKDQDAAVERFNKALDLDGDQLKAFEAINKILNTKKDWKALERAYRKMLHRIIGKGNAELEFNLWHTLGIIFRDRQKNFEAAAEAFKMASNIRPEDGTQHQILAELYGMLPGKVNDAIAEHQWMLQHDVNRVESYRALYKLYFDARAYDKAWCVSATLNYIKKADEEQQRFYKQYKPQGGIRPSSRLDNERWVKDVYHPEEDMFVSKLMEVLGHAVHTARQKSDKALNLVKKKPTDLSSPKGTFPQTFAFVAQVLNVPIVPRLFIEPNAPGGMMPIEGSHPPALVVGSSLSQGHMPQELAFVIGRQLAYYRPEHYIRTIMSSHTELRVMLLAALRIAGLGAADPAADQTAQQLVQFLAAPQIDALRGVARRFVEAGGSTDVKRWMQTVEISCIRAGLLVSNDLEASVKMIQALPPAGSTDLPPKEKMKELILYSISEQYFRAREALGIQIQV